jgi:hypothetical protein
MEPLVIVPLDRDGNEVISTTATMPEGEGLRRSNRLRQLPATNAKVLATEHFSEGLPQECVRRLADPTDALAQMVWSDGESISDSDSGSFCGESCSVSDTASCYSSACSEDFPNYTMTMADNQYMEEIMQIREEHLSMVGNDDADQNLWELHGDCFSDADMDGDCFSGAEIATPPTPPRAPIVAKDKEGTPGAEHQRDQQDRPALKDEEHRDQENRLALQNEDVSNKENRLATQDQKGGEWVDEKTYDLTSRVREALKVPRGKKVGDSVLSGHHIQQLRNITLEFAESNGIEFTHAQYSPKLGDFKSGMQSPSGIISCRGCCSNADQQHNCKTRVLCPYRLRCTWNVEEEGEDEKITLTVQHNANKHAPLGRTKGKGKDTLKALKAIQKHIWKAAKPAEKLAEMKQSTETRDAQRAAGFGPGKSVLPTQKTALKSVNNYKTRINKSSSDKGLTGTRWEQLLETNLLPEDGEALRAWFNQDGDESTMFCLAVRDGDSAAFLNKRMLRATIKVVNLFKSKGRSLCWVLDATFPNRSGYPLLELGIGFLRRSDPNNFGRSCLHSCFAIAPSEDEGFYHLMLRSYFDLIKVLLNEDWVLCSGMCCADAHSGLALACLRVFVADNVAEWLNEVENWKQFRGLHPDDNQVDKSFLATLESFIDEEKRLLSEREKKVERQKKRKEREANDKENLNAFNAVEVAFVNQGKPLSSECQFAKRRIPREWISKHKQDAGLEDTSFRMALCARHCLTGDTSLLMKNGKKLCKDQAVPARMSSILLESLYYSAPQHSAILTLELSKLRTRFKEEGFLKYLLKNLIQVNSATGMLLTRFWNGPETCGDDSWYSQCLEAKHLKLSAGDRKGKLKDAKNFKICSDYHGKNIMVSISHSQKPEIFIPSGFSIKILKPLIS